MGLNKNKEYRGKKKNIYIKRTNFNFFMNKLQLQIHNDLFAVQYVTICIGQLIGVRLVVISVV